MLAAAVARSPSQKRLTVVIACASGLWPLRRAREREKARMRTDDQPKVKQVRDVTIPDAITVQELANRMAERSADVVKELMKLGIMATVTQTIDAETAELIVIELGHKPNRVSEADVDIIATEVQDDDDNLKPRPPVVTVMGHITTVKPLFLMPFAPLMLRQVNLVDHQHIGAYQVNSAAIKSPPVFLMQAFTEMRMRGANITDIMILVVADDGVQQPVKRAMRGCWCPVIIAVNKCDKPEAIRYSQWLLSHEIVTEDFVVMCFVLMF